MWEVHEMGRFVLHSDTNLSSRTRQGEVAMPVAKAEQKPTECIRSPLWSQILRADCTKGGLYSRPGRFLCRLRMRQRQLCNQSFTSRIQLTYCPPPPASHVFLRDFANVFKRDIHWCQDYVLFSAIWACFGSRVTRAKFVCFTRFKSQSLSLASLRPFPGTTLSKRTNSTKPSSRFQEKAKNKR